jgi:amino acid adenylation domain-containing protein
MMSSTLASAFSTVKRSRPATPKRGSAPKITRAAKPNADRKPELLTSVAHLVDACATLSPDALALSSPDAVLTYGQLNESANQLANYLRSLGVGAESSTGAEDIVGICLDRSFTAVVSTLAVLKTGGAYLPIDPAYPSERINFMLNDAKPRALITTSAIASQLQTGSLHVISIDNDKTIASQPTTAPVSEITPEQLAYVIYTSGSTGQPKGVQITHASLMNLVSWHQQAFQISSKDKASLLAGVGFDAAVWETWPYLTLGASLHLPSETTRLSPELLRDWIVAEQITTCFLPTALAEPVMGLEWPTTTGLRTLLTGAETLRQFASARLPFTVVNNYGPTECTVVATSGAVAQGSAASKLPTIGRPIANTQIHILDAEMKPVPEGSTGEIYIGGAGVARGYLNRPELTAERFIPNPFVEDGSERLYRTGDLARYLPSGEIAYVGRIDEQIKILGHRIEPNEIVAVLDRHPAVKASLIVAREDGCREKRLVAYLVMNDEQSTSAADLRAFVGKELPQHMVPVEFVVMERFPVTHNGKIDRAALPAPRPENILRDEAFAEAQTPVEQRLATMLSSLLGVAQVSVRDNFFMLGGHSLLGTQLISQIRNTFNVELGLRALFESPTVAQLSLEVERLLIAQVEALTEEEVKQLLA